MKITIEIELKDVEIAVLRKLKELEDNDEEGRFYFDPYEIVDTDKHALAEALSLPYQLDLINSSTILERNDLTTANYRLSEIGKLALKAIEIAGNKTNIP